MKTENTAARAAQMENGGENAGKSDANAKPLFGLAKRRKPPERYAKCGLKFIKKIWYIDKICDKQYNNY